MAGKEPMGDLEGVGEGALLIHPFEKLKSMLQLASLIYTMFTQNERVWGHYGHTRPCTHGCR
jgi:hypothetical protein